MGRPKVFGIGLSRTGTTSLTFALEILGYSAVHCPHDPLTTAELSAHYLDRSKPFKLSIVENYDALLDTPISSVYQELSEQYPTSQAILTVRNKEAWLNSCSRFWSTAVASLYSCSDTRIAAFALTLHKELYGRPDFDAASFSETYDHYTENVQRWFSRYDSERLLTIDICAGSGWETLCPFLGVEVPNVPFPHANPIQESYSF